MIFIIMKVINELKFDGERERAKGKRKGGRRVAGAIRSLVNARGFQLQCAESYMRHCLCLYSSMVARQ